MAQEFTIKSQAIEDKINQLLPSQGGFQAGVDFSASTMVIPIVDLTESAEGSGLRQDLQSALGHTVSTPFDVKSTTSTIINTTGYFRIFGNFSVYTVNAGNQLDGNITITDGFTAKKLIGIHTNTTNTTTYALQAFDFICKVDAGESITVTSNNNDVAVIGNSRQIADISGNLVNP